MREVCGPYFWAALATLLCTWQVVGAERLFKRSGDVGVARCELQGRVNHQSALLLVWMAACGGDDPTQLHVSGMFFMVDPGSTLNTDQMEHMFDTRDYWAQHENALVLRSPWTGHRHALKLQLASSSWSNSQYRRYQGRLHGVLQLDAEADQRRLEFHILAMGFHTFCTFLAAEARAPPWPQPSAPSATVTGGSGTAQQAEDAPPTQPQRCTWLDDGGGSGGGGNSASGAAAEYDSETLSYMVVSPGFDLPPAAWATLILHHMRYHQAFGVNRYIVYTEGPGTPELEADPRIRAMVRAGRLRVIVWEDTPHYIDLTVWSRWRKDKPVRHPYATQSLVYNHALVSLWAEGATVAIADLDEYLFTAKRTSLRQLMHTCGDKHVVALGVPRRVGYCTSCPQSPGDPLPLPPADDERPPPLDRQRLAASHDAERWLWLNSTAAATDPAAHPLWRYGTTTWEYLPKSMAVAHRVAHTNPHLVFVLPGEARKRASDKCAFWMHLRNQLELRMPDNFTDVQEVNPKWRWALEDMVELDAQAEHR